MVGGGNFGFALTRGNSETTNLALGADAARKTLHDKISLYANSVYASDRILGVTTADAIRGGLRYDRNLTGRLFAYGSGDFEFDELQGLDLRSILGGGLGWHLINEKKTTLDVLGGLAYTRESFDTGLHRNFAGASVGEELTKTLSGSTTLNEKAFFLPYLNDLGNYRATFDLGISAKLTKVLSWQM